MDKQTARTPATAGRKPKAGSPQRHAPETTLSLEPLPLRGVIYTLRGMVDFPLNDQLDEVRTVLNDKVNVLTAVPRPNGWLAGHTQSGSGLPAPCPQLLEACEPGSYIALSFRAYASLTQAQQRALRIVYGGFCGLRILLCVPGSQTVELSAPQISRASDAAKVTWEYIQSTADANVEIYPLP